MSRNEIIGYILDASIIYLIGAFITFTLIMASVYFASKLPASDEAEVRNRIKKITGKPVQNLSYYINGISFWIYLYIAFSWPKAVFRLIKRRFQKQT
jgi:hypothetical protein